MPYPLGQEGPAWKQTSMQVEWEGWKLHSWNIGNLPTRDTGTCGVLMGVSLLPQVGLQPHEMDFMDISVPALVNGAW